MDGKFYMNRDINETTPDKRLFKRSQEKGGNKWL